MIAYFNRFSLEMTRGQAEDAAHSGRCDEDVAALIRDPKIDKQLNAIPADDIRAELKEYGAWDKDELADDYANRERIVWLAAGNINDERR